MKINWEFRKKCARSHSGGHLLDQAMKLAGCPLVGTKGFH
jgi:Ser-tRNA(Ala) deacylase AlaX